MARHAELEAKLIENPGDLEARLVYADWLQGQGDPRGELIALHHRGSPGEAQAFFDAHKTEFLGPIARFARTWDHEIEPAFTWRLGFIQRALVGYEMHTDRALDADDVEEGEDVDDLDSSTVEADRAVDAILAHPSGMLLEELVVRMNMLDDGMYFDPVLKAIARRGAPALRVLRLGEFQQAGPGGVKNGYDYENSWAGFGDASAVWKVLPRLEELRVQMNFGGYSSQNIVDAIGAFDLPRLRRVEIVSGGTSAACVRAFASGDLPALETMELWTGDANYGGDATVEDLAPLLAGDRVPKLARLGIMNCAFADEAVVALARSPLLPRLRELSLAYGMLSDAGAAALAEHRDAFAHLDVIDLTDNYLSPEGMERVRGLCKDVRFAEQRPWNDDYRYVALSE